DPASPGRARLVRGRRPRARPLDARRARRALARARLPGRAARREPGPRRPRGPGRAVRPDAPPDAGSHAMDLPAREPRDARGPRSGRVARRGAAAAGVGLVRRAGLEPRARRRRVAGGLGAGYPGLRVRAAVAPARRPARSGPHPEPAARWVAAVTEADQWYE